MSTTKSADRPHGRAGGALARDSQSLYRAENFEAALSALEEHAGDNPELLAVGVLPCMAEFQVKDGQSAKGDGDLAWSVNAECDQRAAIVFQADPESPGRQTPPGGRSSAASRDRLAPRAVRLV